jgi:hypothetical protein
VSASGFCGCVAFGLLIFVGCARQANQRPGDCQRPSHHDENERQQPIAGCPRQAVSLPGKRYYNPTRAKDARVGHPTVRSKSVLPLLEWPTRPDPSSGRRR